MRFWIARDATRGFTEKKMGGRGSAVSVGELALMGEGGGSVYMVGWEY